MQIILGFYNKTPSNSDFVPTFLIIKQLVDMIRNNFDQVVDFPPIQNRRWWFFHNSRNQDLPTGAWVDDGVLLLPNVVRAVELTPNRIMNTPNSKVRPLHWVNFFNGCIFFTILTVLSNLRYFGNSHFLSSLRTCLLSSSKLYKRVSYVLPSF